MQFDAMAGSCASHNKMKCWVILGVVLVVVAGTVALLCYLTMPNEGPKTSSPGQLSPEVRTLCDNFWRWGLQDRPQYATRVGIHDYDDRLDDLSLTAYNARLTAVLDFLERVDDLEPRLTERVDIVNIRVLRDTLETFRDGYRFRNFYMALNNREGIQRYLLKILSWMPLETEANYRTLLARLRKVPIQLSQIVTLFKSGVQVGVTQHERAMHKVPSQITPFLVSDPVQSPIYQQFFVSLPPNISSSVQEDARRVIADEVTPAFQNLFQYVTTSYVARPNIAVTSLPNGTNLYMQIIKFHTGSALSPHTIHQTGHREVERLEALMQEIVNQLGHNMTIQEFSSMIRDDPNNYYGTEEELLEAFRHIVYNVTTPATLRIFKQLPIVPLEVSADPSGTSAYYHSFNYGTRPGVLYVGTKDISSRPKNTMMTNSLHEGNPGHHLQNSHAIYSPTMPEFRRSGMTFGEYTLAPSRFPRRIFYFEGWALYSEGLGFDMDLYGDPLARFGHYTAETFRASRLVVDTGIHALGWTRDKAINYLLEHTTLTQPAAENEVDRYIAWPGQALSYKVGQLHLSAFRAKAEELLGDKFNLKDFHEVILESIGPMIVVEDQVDQWIQRVLGNQ